MLYIYIIIIFKKNIISPLKNSTHGSKGAVINLTWGWWFWRSLSWRKKRERVLKKQCKLLHSS